MDIYWILFFKYSYKNIIKYSFSRCYFLLFKCEDHMIFLLWLSGSSELNSVHLQYLLLTFADIIFLFFVL